MAEEKKTTPAPEEQKPEPPAPETPDAPTPPGLEALTVEEQLILEHEGRAALFEMGEAIPDASEFSGVMIPEQPAPEPEAQVVLPGMEGPPAPENKVIDLSSIRADAGREQQAGPAQEEAPAPPAPEPPSQLKDASRAEKEEIVYLDLDQLHPFQNHPFGVRDDVEMQGLVSSVKPSR